MASLHVLHAIAIACMVVLTLVTLRDDQGFLNSCMHGCNEAMIINSDESVGNEPW
jgi:hypothetical protein